MSADLPADIYPLDPRREGDEGAELVAVVERRRAAVELGFARFVAVNGHHEASTVREALHAARVAAGLGDVGEKACDAPCWVDIHQGRPTETECCRCRWPRVTEKGAPQSE